ncbi:MAG: hypothetical protein GF331_19020 [Chitinivibrionales bacterium]|nr:hypothetical protein [Chitinivibrionales bacterium]
MGFAHLRESLRIASFVNGGTCLLTAVFLGRGSMMRLTSGIVGLVGTLLGVSSPSAQNITVPASLVAPGEAVEVLESGMEMTEGPAVDSAGNLFFTTPFQNTIWRIPPGGNATVFDDASNGANGLVFDTQDRLLACEKQRVTRREHDGSTTVLATVDGWANDLSLAPDGGIYFTQPTWDKPESSYVFYRAPDGNLQTLQAQVPGFPNGIEYVAEKNRLYIAYSQRNLVMAYTLDQNNAFVDSLEFATVTTPDGFALDEHGNLWITSNSMGRVEVFDSTGQPQGHIVATGQSRIQNCAFGGPDNSILYITGGSAVLRLQTAVSGRSTRGDAGVGVDPARRGSLPRFAPGGLRLVRRADGFGVSVSDPDDAASLSLHTIRGRLLRGPAPRSSQAVSRSFARVAPGCHVWAIRDEHMSAYGTVTTP